MARFQRPRGTRDFAPEEMETRRWAERAMRNVICSYGYNEISTPTFEETDLFIERSGPQILQQIYSFEDKGGRSLALRPELTAPVMRFFHSDMRNRPKPLRISYFGNCFRYERPQKGRYREFWQMGVEYIGKRTALALGEVIEVAISSLKAIGLADFTVRVGHVSLLSSILERYGADPQKDKELMIFIDKKDTEGIRSYINERMNKDPSDLIDLVTQTYTGDQYRQILDDLIGSNDDINESVKELESVLELLFINYANEDIRLDPSISRGLDYYDGVVFEIDASQLGAEKQICGGGAYSLSSLFDDDVLGIGFGLGFDRIIVALGQTEKMEDSEGGVFIMPVGDESGKLAFNIASKLREKNVTCILETTARNFKKSISYALTQGCHLMIVVGPDEIEKRVVSVKNLRSRNQVEVSIDELTEYILGLFSPKQ